MHDVQKLVNNLLLCIIKTVSDEVNMDDESFARDKNNEIITASRTDEGQQEMTLHKDSTSYGQGL